MRIAIITYLVSAAKIRITEVLNEMSTPDFDINQSFSNDPRPIQSACFGAVKKVDKKYGRDLFWV